MTDQGLYHPAHEHDSCGVGFLVHLDGHPTHELIAHGVLVLQNLLHRGALGGDRSTGDGAGILIQVPDAFLRRECARQDIALPPVGQYGVGMVFLPSQTELTDQCRAVVERLTLAQELQFLGWRDVPVDPQVLGNTARRTQPRIAQCFVGGRTPGGVAILERRLYVLRKRIEHEVHALFGDGIAFSIPSFSCRTLVYKGLLMGVQVSGFYPDLEDETLVSALAVVHQRYSTNTFPSWKLAQPFRYLAHNGEINTLRGNLLRMQARESLLASEAFGADVRHLLPIIEPGGSDSAALDNALELLVAGGRSLAHAMSMLIPVAWGVKYPLGPDLRGFFEYHAGLMEPWDGPAAVAFSDGVQVGALTDRNGLRPARYLITKGGFMVLASEAGVLPIPAADVQEKGALRPGEMILADLPSRRVVRDDEIKSILARRQPYRRWVEENKLTLQGFFGAVAPVQPAFDTLFARQALHGYTREDLRLILEPMAATGHEPVGSMGCDTPLAVLSEKPQSLFAYFKQLFAQVTNPPIDPIREELVMSLMTFIGNAPNILQETPQNARLIKLRHPVLSNEDLAQIQALRLKHFSARTLPIGCSAPGNGAALAAALTGLGEAAETAVRAGHNLLVLSDRNLPPGAMPMPALLAVSVVNRQLASRGLRTAAGVIIETGEAREVMHVALLLGYGATAVNPYLAFESVAALALNRELSADLVVAKAVDNYINALCEGLRKIMSKMGISTLRSYRGAQVFEAVGLNRAFLDRYFPGALSRVGGIGLAEIAAEYARRYHAAQAAAARPHRVLPSGGHYRFRADGERHLWTPEAIGALQQAVRTGDAARYRDYAQRINDQTERQFTLRGLFAFKPPGPPLPLEAVEAAEDICRRFVTSAMSFGSISREAHETIAVAMNRLGAMSNCGEGGEDPARYALLPNGDNRCSAVKQVASGRFGVTAEYCVNCRELQIKIAQGAKPGEGGQLPGHKVNREIARVRHATPGVSLISPPPHHDIYSIEDIKQLIYDLKCVNPAARVSVKLVAELGVGTVAAGVAKAHADAVLISGCDGGTGASPLSSIRHAGAPWEIGLAETQQTLVLNGLRRRIRVQADGQMKTGRDVMIAALLGAEEFGFATAPLVVLGCVMMRKCHTNTCPMGVATQDPELRKFFTGRPEHLINYFHFVAQEVREYLARLGFRTLDEAVGRSDCLEMNRAIGFWKARGLDFSQIFHRPDMPDEPVRCVEAQRHELEEALDQRLIPLVREGLECGRPVTAVLPISNVQRAVGAMLAGEVARRYGHAGLPPETIVCRFRGSAGQSFGAWCPRGVTLILEGEANDYLGKGLSGGRIVVKPFPGVEYDPAANTIAGNVLLYGATAGEVFLCGKAGERFAVRNSGALAVVEGVGDHGCEYMTGGRVVILGQTGLNFAAGMSGGIAYVFDEDRRFDSRCNLDMVDLELLTLPEDIADVRDLIAQHAQYTGSRKAARILAHWETSRSFFVKVFPMEYRRVLGQMSHDDEATERQEVAHG